MKKKAIRKRVLKARAERTPKPRRGQRKPYTKRTEQEVEEIIDTLERKMRRRPYTKSELKAWCKEYHNLEYRTALDYIARARERILVRLSRSKEELTAESLAFYEAVMSNKNVSMSTKLRARERVDKLLGLEAPTKMKLDHNVVDDDVVDVEALDLPMATRKKMLAQVRKQKSEAAPKEEA